MVRPKKILGLGLVVLYLESILAAGISFFLQFPLLDTIQQLYFFRIKPICFFTG